MFTYAFLLYALWSRYMRSSVLDNLVQDYVRTARAKGASERRVIWGHVFRNSLVSIVTLLGLSLPTLVGGAILIEVVFNYPGMGLAFYQAALNNDYEVLLGFTVLATVATIVGNLLADIGYARARPEGEVLMSSEAQVIAATDAELGLAPSTKPRGMLAPVLGSVRREQARAGRPRLHRLHPAVLLRRPAHLRDQPDEHRPDQLPVPRRRARTCSAATTSATTSSAG